MEAGMIREIQTKSSGADGNDHVKEVPTAHGWGQRQAGARRAQRGRDNLAALPVQPLSQHKMDRAIIFCLTKLDCDNSSAILSRSEESSIPA